MGSNSASPGCTELHTMQALIAVSAARLAAWRPGDPAFTRSGPRVARRPGEGAVSGVRR